MEYMTIQEAAERWGITERRIQVLCTSNRLPGATKFGRQWAIPANLPKPLDERIKSGKYTKDSSLGITNEAPVGNHKKVIFSFFSGSGFLDLGFETSGFDIDFVNEFHPAFMDAYKYSRSKMQLREPKYGYFQTDINDFLGVQSSTLRQYIQAARNEGSLVGFIGGPPCPDFSVAGKNRGRDGDNGRLSKSYVDLIIKMKPDFFLFENVKGLWRTARHRAFFEELKGLLHSAGYTTTERLTNALEYGVPQDRDRILLLAFRKAFSALAILLLLAGKSTCVILFLLLRNSRGRLPPLLRPIRKQFAPLISPKNSLCSIGLRRTMWNTIQIQGTFSLPAVGLPGWKQWTKATLAKNLIRGFIDGVILPLSPMAIMKSIYIHTDCAEFPPPKPWLFNRCHAPLSFRLQ